MKYTKSISLAALLSASSAYATTLTSYYEYEIIAPDTTGSNYGPYATGLTEDSDTFSVFALKSDLDQDIDIGLPFTFNQECFYDDDVCEEIYYGSEDTTDLSYENGYQAWRTAMAEMDQGVLDPESYTMGATNNVKIEGFDDDTEVKVTDVVNSSFLGGSYAVGYGSGPYTDGERDYVRRAFVIDTSTSYATISLIPTAFDDDDGGFSSAYRMRDVTYENGDTKTLIVGNASKSLAGGDTDYFDYCYNEGDETDVDDLNYLVYCPGFDTQAWAWEYDDSATEIEGFELASEWLDDNEDRDSSSDVTYSAAAFDINDSGIAVGVSSYEHSDSAQGARQRAIIMTPDDDGVYSEPTELTKATSGVSDQDDSIYNTWAQTITDEDDIVMGNRQYAVSKNVNKPIEMFIYDIDDNSVTFPFLNKIVLTTKQRLAGTSASSKGANSRGYDMNNEDLVVGKADAYGETDPTVGGSARTQSAFLYDNSTGDSWYIEDLLCTQDEDGVVTHPLIRLQSATAINDEGVVLAEGYQYSSISNYTNLVDATAIFVKLTPDSDSEPDESPNCWESEALSSDDDSYSGGASFWLWIFALPLILVRRLTVNKK